MRPLRTRLIRAVALALLILTFTANVVAANEGAGIDCVPFDPGYEEALPPLPQLPDPPALF